MSMGFFGKGRGSGDGNNNYNDNTAFARWFNKTSNDEPRKLRVFDRGNNGNYFTCHGADAFCVAKGLFKTTAVVKYWNTGVKDPNQAKLATVTLNKSAYEGVCRMVLVEGTAFAPATSSPDQLAKTGDQAHNKKSILAVYHSQGGGGSWQCKKQGSPSRLESFEQELCMDAAQPVVLAVVVQDRNRKEYDDSLLAGASSADCSDHVVGASFCNPQGEGGGLAHYSISSCDFLDDPHFCVLEALVVQSGAKECLVQVLEPPGGAKSASSSSATTRQRVLDVFDRCGVLVTEREGGGGSKDTFDHGRLERDLGRLQRDSQVERCRDVLDRKVASRAAQLLLEFAELLQDKRNFGRWEVRVHDTGRHMRMDAAAIKALNVTAQPGQGARGSGGAPRSLQELLGRGRTPMGKRLARTWLKQPLTDVEEIERRLAVVNALVSDSFLRGDLRDGLLRGVPDVDRLVRKLERGTATLRDLCALYRVSCRIEDICGALDGNSEELLRRKFSEPLRSCHDADHLGKFEDLLESAVDLDRAPEEFLICPNYSDDLEATHLEKEETGAEVYREAERIADDLGKVLDKSVKLEWHKYSNQRERCMRITAKEEKLVRKQLQRDYTILETRKDGTKFTSKGMKTLAKRLSKLTDKYDECQKDLVAQVVGVASTFAPVWQRVSGLVAELDCLCGFADLACSAPRPYCKPEVLPSSTQRISLKGCRHPLVEFQDLGGTGDGAGATQEDFIPNDCDLVRGESWFQVVTGPNMGGKSTYIRQVGVAVLLAQCGCFVPCDEATISVRDAVYARVGAGDCQQRGVSTFMAEMLETASILKGATKSSLVVIDELGRGTSTNDGFGLAWAISEHLMRETGCACLFATHFHELTSLRDDACGVLNRHVVTNLDPKTGGLTMLYKVEDGPCERSFGIAVAEKVGFPGEVVSWAKGYERNLSKRVRLTAPPARD